MEWGRIVKGVNTTPDVGPNEIKTQAAKFGNTVDKDGRPPSLSKKVKGSKTNVLFNLGLTESIEEEVQTTAPDWNPRPWDDLDIKNYKDRIDRDYHAITGRDQDFKNKILAMFPNPQRPDYKTAKQLLAKYEKEHEAVQAYINKRIKEVKATEKPGQQRTWLKSEEYKKLARKKNSINAVMAQILNMLSDTVDEAWSKKYKRSINCNNPKGFSQRAHCQGRKK